MSFLLFACKRGIKNTSFLVLLVVYVAAIFTASLDGAAGAYPPAGVCGGDDSAARERIVSYLTDNGFVLFDDEEEMLGQVEDGTLDCGVVLPDDLSRRLEAGEMNGCARFLESPLSLIPERYRGHASAALFREYAPHIAASALADAGIAQEELLTEYEEMFAQGYAFSFEILTTDGAYYPENTESTLVIGAAALLLFALVLGTGTNDGHTGLLRRLGVKKMLLIVVVPQELVYTGAAAAAGSVGLALADAAQWIVPLWIYALLLCVLRILLSAFLGDRERCILVAVILLLSLALCPVFVDLTLFAPALGALRCLLAPYWFWLALRAPFVCLLVGCAVMPLACAVLCARWSIVEKLRLH